MNIWPWRYAKHCRPSPESSRPDTVVISDATSRLCRVLYLPELDVQALRGVAEPVAVYRVLREVVSTVDWTSRALVDSHRWSVENKSWVALGALGASESWQGQVVLLTGDAGIGKSRLVQMLKEYVANEPHMRWECRSASYFENTALFPVTDLFQRLLQFHAEDTADAKSEKLEHALSRYRLPLEESVPLFAPLLSLPIPENRYPLLTLSPQRQRQKTLETIVAILLEHAERQPVLFIVEDLHWTDPSTLELLNLVIEQTLQPPY